MVSRAVPNFEEVLVAPPRYLAKPGLLMMSMALEPRSFLVVSDGIQRTRELTDGDHVYRVQDLQNSLRTSSPALAQVAALNNKGLPYCPRASFATIWHAGR
jgi:hypothetical protein